MMITGGNNKRMLSAVLLLLSNSITLTQGFVAPSNRYTGSSSKRITPSSSTRVEALPAALASLVSGSVAGAVGVGVAFPLDTIKTKAQVLATTCHKNTQNYSNDDDEAADSYHVSSQQQQQQLVVSPSGTAAAQLSTTASTTTATRRTIRGNSSMLEVGQHIWETEGLSGFFAGVQTSMAGQAIIKAVVFASNAAILDACRQSHAFGDQTALQLLFAAASAGFITAFIAAPVDRIKVLMQAAGQEYKGQEDQCLKAVLQTEGWKGLMGRGLACTMVREVPAYSLYFGVYEGLQQWSTVADQLGPLAPLIFGAIAGMACWIPIYPIDVVKTVIQNTKGEYKERSAWEVTSELYQTHGLSVFYDGIAPRLLRQAVNHAVTFGVYDALYHNVLT